MKRIQFKSRNAGGYGCSEPGDNSGEYVRAEVAEKFALALADYKRCYKSVCMILGWMNEPPLATLENDLKARRTLLGELQEEAANLRVTADDLQRRLTAAMRFVPTPEEMTEEDDAELIELVLWLRGKE